jgi:eukaryotic-like serine/threonine-protein kinase
MPTPNPQDPLSGTRYRALRQLGMGTMGDVFLVEHVALGRRFVAKVLHTRHAQTDEYVTRLRREARTLGQIQHPNIVAATDFGVTDDGRPFIVMEYLEGHTLDQELKQRGSLQPADAFSYTRHVLSALAAA